MLSGMEGSCGREGVVAGGQQVLVRVCWFSEQVRGNVLASDRDGRVRYGTDFPNAYVNQMSGWQLFARSKNLSRESSP